MPAKARSTHDGQDARRDHSQRTASISDRVAAFTMLDGMREATQAQKCLRLALAGFSNTEIAEMLQTSAAVVAQSVYAERKRSHPGDRPNRTKNAAKPSAGGA